MKLSNIKIAIALAFAFMLGTTQGTAHLIGISNKTGQGFPTPRIAISGTTITSIPYTANNVGLQNIKVNLPVEVTLNYDSTINEGKPYTIRIEESGSLGNCQGNKKMIVAKILEGGAPQQTCCVTLAKNSFSLSSDPYEWENVVLAIANNTEYKTNTKALPFKFGVAPWTTTKLPWNKMTVEKTADTSKNAAKQFTHEWSSGPENGLKGLKVMQGNTAWMGGDITQNLIPKKGFDHITHIYNNTPYVLNVTRNIRNSAQSGSNFNQLIPAWSAVPWTMAWIPTIPKSDFHPDQDQQLSAIQIYALYAPDADQPKLPGAVPILTKTGSTEHSVGKDTDDIIAGMQAGHSEYISGLLGETPIKDLMPNIDKDQYAVGNEYFRIFTIDNQNGTTYIQKCDNSTQECQDYATVPAPKTNPQFGYFKLIVSEDRDDIKLNLSPAPYEKVLED